MRKLNEDEIKVYMQYGIMVPNKMWFTLRECCELKGLSYKTALNKPRLKPRAESQKIGGRKMYRRDDVIEWLSQPDAEAEKEWAKKLS